MRTTRTTRTTTKESARRLAIGLCLLLTLGATAPAASQEAMAPAADSLRLQDGVLSLTLEEATQPLTEEPSAGIRAWQDEQTRQAIREADAGDFATAEEVKAVIRRYVPHD